MLARYGMHVDVLAQEQQRELLTFLLRGDAGELLEAWTGHP
jgi:hypothetical protein